MGLRQRLAEGLFRMRIIPNSGPEDVTSFTKQKDSLPTQIDEAIESGKRIELNDFLKINDLKVDRNTKYTIFEEMVADGRIGAAVEMYANDTVQYNPEGKIMWVESENPDVVKYVEKLLDDLNLKPDVWTHAYRLYLYGDVYLELFKSSSVDKSKPNLLLEPLQHNGVNIQKPIIGQVLERYVELVPNPANVYDLQYRGKTSGYAKSDETLVDDITQSKNAFYYTNASTSIDLLEPTKYVHICLSPNINRFPEKFRLVKDNIKHKVREDGLIDGTDTEGASGGDLTFNVKSGQSILENVYGPYQTLKLKEDSVLLERITKSSITRIIQIELGDMPEPQKKLRLQEIKNQIEQQLLLNKDAGNIQSRPGAQPIENILYTTTNNGKGVISTVNVGGDAEIGDTSDIDKSENKLYGSLLIPKALLGADMEGSGLSNGGSLTEMNTTYARRIKRGQQALINGYTDLINIFALAEGVGDLVVNNFQIRLTPIITVEDTRRDELLSTKINNVRDIMQLIDGIDIVEDKTKLDMMVSWLSTYLSQQDIVDILNNTIADMEQQEEDEKEFDIEKDDNNHKDNSFGASSRPPKIDIHNDIDIPEDNTNDDIEIDTTETPETPDLEIPTQTDLSNIEGEDLL